MLIHFEIHYSWEEFVVCEKEEMLNIVTPNHQDASLVLEEDIHLSGYPTHPLPILQIGVYYPIIYPKSMYQDALQGISLILTIIIVGKKTKCSKIYTLNGLDLESFVRKNLVASACISDHNSIKKRKSTRKSSIS